MKMKRYRHATLIIVLLGINSIPFVSSFSQKSVTSWTRSRPDRPLYGTKQVRATPDGGNFLKSVSLASLLIYSIAAQSVTPVWADEYGRETEVPTDFTGENVMICTKRGPLGACTETTMRTSTNDNDKASKYFGDPAAALKEKYRVAQLQQLDNQNSEKEDESEGSQLLKRLKQQSIENKDKNEKSVRQKTLQNDLSASFGPFDREVAVINSDGDSYTILSGPQATRLKKQGYLKGTRFVTQPTQEIIDAAATSEGDDGFVGALLRGIFGESN